MIPQDVATILIQMTTRPTMELMIIEKKIVVDRTTIAKEMTTDIRIIDLKESSPLLDSTFTRSGIPPLSNLTRNNERLSKHLESKIDLISSIQSSILPSYQIRTQSSHF